jgi:hypothetical protein
MPTYMDVHDGFVGVTKEQLEQAHQADLDIQAEEGVSFDRVWHDTTSGKVFCLATGPDKGAVERIHARTGHPAHATYEVSVELS